MQHDRFKELLEELDGNSVATLAEKNARYSSSDDALHNFKSGADIMGGTPAQACWGYMTKHLTALRDMVERDDFSNREDFLEKCQDTINYVRFLWCIGNEKIEETQESTEKCVGEFNKEYVVYGVSDNKIVDRYSGDKFDVEVYDNSFVICGGICLHKYYFRDFYFKEHIRRGDEIMVKEVKEKINKKEN